MPSAISSSANLNSQNAYQAALLNATRIEKAIRMEEKGQKVADLPRYIAAFHQLINRALEKDQEGVSPALRNHHTELLNRLQKLEPQVSTLSPPKSLATIPFNLDLGKEWPWKRVAKYAAGGAIGLAAIAMYPRQLIKIVSDLPSTAKTVGEGVVLTGHAAAQAVPHLQHAGQAAASAAGAVPQVLVTAANELSKFVTGQPITLEHQSTQALGLKYLLSQAAVATVLSGVGSFSIAQQFRQFAGHPAQPNPNLPPALPYRIAAGITIAVPLGITAFPENPVFSIGALALGLNSAMIAASYGATKPKILGSGALGLAFPFAAMSLSNSYHEPQGYLGRSASWGNRHFVNPVVESCSDPTSTCASVVNGISNSLRSAKNWVVQDASNGTIAKASSYILDATDTNPKTALLSELTGLMAVRLARQKNYSPLVSIGLGLTTSASIVGMNVLHQNGYTAQAYSATKSFATNTAIPFIKENWDSLVNTVFEYPRTSVSLGFGTILGAVVGVASKSPLEGALYGTLGTAATGAIITFVEGVTDLRNLVQSYFDKNKEA